MADGFLSIEDYPKVKKTIENTFHADARLPGYVFRKKYRFTLLCDFTHVHGANFVTLVNNEIFCSKSDRILISVLDPDPISFHEHFHKINSVYFHAAIAKEEYKKLLYLDPGNPNDALMYTAEVLVWLPSNSHWAMWGQRDREIAVIGFDDPAQADFLLNEDGYWIDAETAIGDDAFGSTPFYPDHKVPENFARALIENYGSRRNLEHKLKEAGIALKPGIWKD